MSKIRREDKSHGGWQDWAIDRVLRALIAGMNRLPLRMRLQTMSFVMRRVIAGPTGYRDRALANLAYVWPDRAKADRKAIAEAALDNAARTLIENYDVSGLRRRMADVTPEGPGYEVALKAQREGRPVLFVTGHFGNFEGPRACLVENGFDIGGLYRRMSNPYFNAHYEANMHALSGPVFPQGRRGTMGLIKHLKQGGMAVLLFDVFDGAGVPLLFMGKPAPTLTSAADIAERTGAVMIPFFGIRDTDGVTLRAVFEAPLAPGTALERTTELTQRLEAQIEQRPGQWFWIHRRWKPKRQAKRQRKMAAPKISP